MRQAIARAAIASLLSVWVGACAATPPAPARDHATTWGFVRLVPREGVTPRRPGSSPYADPALRDVEFVDYSRPGFAVVYLEGTPSPGGTASVHVRDGRLRAYLDPPRAAVGVGGKLRISNAGARAHVVSLPEAGSVHRLEPGQDVEIALTEPGEQPLFLLDAPEVAGRIFVAPGRFSVVSAAGRWELRDVPPGRIQLRAWHPRFPPVSRMLELRGGSVERIDLEMGVDSLAESKRDG